MSHACDGRVGGQVGPGLWSLCLWGRVSLHSITVRIKVSPVDAEHSAFHVAGSQKTLLLHLPIKSSCVLSSWLVPLGC